MPLPFLAIGQPYRATAVGSATGRTEAAGAVDAVGARAALRRLATGLSGRSRPLRDPCARCHGRSRLGSRGLGRAGPLESQLAVLGVHADRVALGELALQQP